MSGTGKCTAKVLYMNNLERVQIGLIPYVPTDKGADILPEVIQLLANAGHPFDRANARIFLKRENEWTLFDGAKLLDSDEIIIICSEIAALRNAARYDEVAGIIFFFHTDENNHLYSPHIHAFYAGEEISISLIDYHVVGRFKSRAKMKLATTYVRENTKNLLNCWNQTRPL